MLWFSTLGSNNPWKVAISYKTIAPWLGRESRKSVFVPNSEYKKGNTLNRSKPKLTSSKLSHDQLMECVFNTKTVSFCMIYLVKKFVLTYTQLIYFLVSISTAVEIHYHFYFIVMNGKKSRL